MTKPKLRCAVYTRKSSEEGLEQDFNSLDAQREACEAYIKSQASEGWSLVKTKYDDGGYSGGNTERPGLTALLDDIDAGLLDVVVVYKVDRLTRSLSDFVRVIARFDQKKTSFVSVTQSFNTTTSMGRLTLNMLLSFAQFEREVTAERIRDKYAASKQKGMWMGGTVPLGYEPDGRTLSINDEEAKTVRFIFKRYTELKSVDALVIDLKERGIKSKARISQRGNKSGGCDIVRGALNHLLSNPLYTGLIRHKDKTYPGQHKAIVSQQLWDDAQAVMAYNRGDRAPGKTSAKEEFWLTGRIFDALDRPMTPTYTVRAGGKRYKYYAVDSKALSKTDDDTEITRLRMQFTHDLIEAVIARRTGLKPGAPLVHDCVRSVHVTRDKLCVEVAVLPSGDPRSAYNSNGTKDHKAEILKIDVPVRVSKKGQRSEIIAPPDLAAPEANAGLINALRQAWQWRQMLETGKYGSVEVMAESEGVSKRYVNRIFPLSFLAPSAARIWSQLGE